MSTKTNIGKSVYFSPALPATNDAAGFEALTWTEVDHPIQAPQFGLSHGNTDVPNLKSGFTTGAKGAASGKDSQSSYAIDNGARTAGQTALKENAETLGTVGSFKVGRGSGTDGALVTGDPVVYAQGYTHSYEENQATDNSYEGFSVNFKQNAVAVEATEPA
jgi:hypothetical protein